MPAAVAVIDDNPPSLLPPPTHTHSLTWFSSKLDGERAHPALDGSAVPQVGRHGAQDVLTRNVPQDQRTQVGGGSHFNGTLSGQWE